MKLLIVPPQGLVLYIHKVLINCPICFPIRKNRLIQIQIELFLGQSCPLKRIQPEPVISKELRKSRFGNTIYRRHGDMIKGLLCLGIFLLSHFNHYGQSVAPDSLVKKRVDKFLIVVGVGYAVSLVGLNQIWYKDFPRSRFHFFDDNPEWKQIDKLGHFYNSYQLSKASAVVLTNLGQEDKKSYVMGSLLGFTMLSSIEIMDGFSAEYGASWGDILANGVGAGFSLGQYLLWQETRIHPKYSFSSSKYAALRPEVLGHTWHEQVIKDYNGQTQWLSFDISKFLSEGSRFPKWLNLAIGYGADALVFARDAENKAAGFEPYRQYYLAVDFDLTHIKTNSKFANTLLYLVNMIHLPAPALEYNNNEGFKLLGLFF